MMMMMMIQTNSNNTNYNEDNDMDNYDHVMIVYEKNIDVLLTNMMNMMIIWCWMSENNVDGG